MFYSIELFHFTSSNGAPPWQKLKDWAKFEISAGAWNTKGWCITVPLTSCLTGLVCFANKNKNCQLSYSWYQTSQTGGQWYSNTSPFSIPCSSVQCHKYFSLLIRWCIKVGRFIVSNFSTLLVATVLHPDWNWKD